MAADNQHHGVVEESPKQWKVRAALRAFERAGDDESPHPAEAILNAGLELIRERDDFTVKQLSERAGVAVQTFYRHFGTKDELILALMEENIARGAARMRDEAARIVDPVARLRELTMLPITNAYDEAGVRSLQWASRERQRLMPRYAAAVDGVHQPYRMELQRAIEAVVEAGRGWSASPALDATIVQHLVLLMTHLTHVGGIDQTPDVVAGRIWSLVWQGMSSEPDPVP